MSEIVLASLLSPAGSSGKRTLFGILGGFLLPSAGSVWVGDRDMTYMPLLKRNIGIVFPYKELRKSMQIELRQLHRKLGSTIVYVTHDQCEALSMSDRVAILKDGELVQIGAPAALGNEPKGSFVASFIGDVTLLPMTSVGDHVRLGEVTLRSAKAISAHPELLLAFQNEKLLSDEGQHELDVKRPKCRFREVMYQGNSLRLFLELEDGMPLRLCQPSYYVAQKKNHRSAQA